MPAARRDIVEILSALFAASIIGGLIGAVAVLIANAVGGIS